MEEGFLRSQGRKGYKSYGVLESFFDPPAVVELAVAQRLFWPEVPCHERKEPNKP
jgi:hypothetical protein